ncbi:hypothetical protein SAMN05216520_1052 [Kandleria vitulina]|nr:hypothetical protein SAMN05216520_1052 [Kandleria vitulina]
MSIIIKILATLVALEFLYKRLCEKPTPLGVGWIA